MKQRLIMWLAVVARPDLAIDGRGVALATWHWGTGTSASDPGYHGEVQVAEGRSAQPWSLPEAVSGSESCDRLRAPRVSVGGAGAAVVWWQCDLAGDRSTAFSSSRAPDQPFAADRELPFRSAGDLAADLVVSGNGTAVAVSADGVALHFWRGPVRADGVTLEELPVAGSRPTLDRAGGPPQVGVNDDGDALAAWIGSDLRTRAAVIASDLGVAAPAALDPGKQSPAGVRVAVGGGRLGLVAWTASGRVIASSRAADGSLAARHAGLGHRGLHGPGARGGDGRRRQRARLLDEGPRGPLGRGALGAGPLRTRGRAVG